MAKRKRKQDKQPFLYGDSDWLFSLSKFLGKKIVDVVGYPSDPFGGTPVFVMTRIIFEDGSEISMEGEHDTVYLPADDKLQNMDEDVLQSFIEE